MLALTRGTEISQREKSGPASRKFVSHDHGDGDGGGDAADQNHDVFMIDNVAR